MRAKPDVAEPVVDRPIFVVGVDHSGTTILYRMLARHPEVAWFSQYSLRDGNMPGRARVPLNGWINRTGRSLAGHTWRKELRVVRPEPRECFGIWRRLIPRNDALLYASDCTDELAERVRRVVASDLRAWRLERMLMKTPYLTRRILLLDRIFPDALFVHIVRDGRAVALSNRERIAKEGGLAPEEALRKSAAYWVQTLDYVEECAELLGPRFSGIRYENFCQDVHGALNAAFRVCGLDPAAAHLDGVPRTLTPTNDRWLRECSAGDRAILDEELRETLIRWDYFPFDDAGRDRAAAS
jgi:hypothetical protein